MIVRRFVIGAVVLAAMSSSLHAQSGGPQPDGAVPAPNWFISEVLYNPVGTDGGLESIEIMGPPGSSAANLKIFVIEGDSGSTTGNLTAQIDLTPYSFGSNGLLLLRDGPTAIDSGVPLVFFSGSNPSTTVAVGAIPFVTAGTLQNGSQTYVLAFGAPAYAALTDSDTNNDGVLDLYLGTIVDAVGFLDGFATDVTYATNLSFPTVTLNASSGALYRLLDASGAPTGWAAGAITGAGSGPFVFSTPNVGFPFGPGSSRTCDLGRRNESMCTLALDNDATPGQPLSIDVSGGVPNALYLTALTLNAANGPTPPYTGIHAGLVIDLAELSSEFAILNAPFVGTLDGSGAASYATGPLPALGMTLYGTTLLYDLALGDFVGRSPIVSVNL